MSLPTFKSKESKSDEGCNDGHVLEGVSALNHKLLGVVDVYDAENVLATVPMEHQ